MNTKATADAIAGRFTGITANGASISVGPTASLPNQVGKGPTLLVYPPVGVLSVGVSRIRGDELDFPVRLLLDPLNVPARTDALYAWWDAMRDRVEMHMTLGLPYVAWARAIAGRAEIDGESYAGLSGARETFDVVEFIIRVHFDEVVTTVAS